MRATLLIAAGGSLGCILRAVIAAAFNPERAGDGLPYGTLAINTAGCLAIGLVLGWLETGRTSDQFATDARSLIVIGLLGGFTTFSAFAFEAFALIRNGHPGTAGLYILLSNALGLAAAWAGVATSRVIAGV